MGNEDGIPSPPPRPCPEVRSVKENIISEEWLEGWKGRMDKTLQDSRDMVAKWKRERLAREAGNPFLMQYIVIALSLLFVGYLVGRI